MHVSKEGEKFLIDMKVYLLMKGRKEEDIESFLEDAELHLIEGEKDGKTVQDIFGHSPEAYAEELAKEMEGAKKENFKLLVLFIIGVLAYWCVPDLLFHGTDEAVFVSLISLIGYPIVLAISIPMGLIAFRKSTFITSKLKEFSILYICIAILPIILIVCIMLLNKWYEPPLFYLSPLQSYILGGLLLFLAAIINMRLAGWMGLLLVVILFTIMFVFECTAIKDTKFDVLEPVFLYGSLILLMNIDLKKTETSKM
ncbi:DUF1129 domain-containing protein [Bacillus sp. C1]